MSTKARRSLWLKHSRRGERKTDKTKTPHQVGGDHLRRAGGLLAVVVMEKSSHSVLKGLPERPPTSQTLGAQSPSLNRKVLRKRILEK